MPKEEQKTQKPKETSENQKAEKTAETAPAPVAEKIQESNHKPKKARGAHTTKTTLIIGGLDILCMLVLLFLLFALPKKALEVKKHRNIIVSAKARSEVEIADLQVKQNTEKANALENIFPNEFGLVDFVKEIETLTREGSVREFTFANKNPVNDKIGGLGIPVVIVFEGSWQDIDRDLKKLHQLPYIFRPITVDVERLDTNLQTVEYGGFLYVNPDFQS